jgi:NADH pyrophosphatase NudC (nudix superfamily)
MSVDMDEWLKDAEELEDKKLQAVAALKAALLVCDEHLQFCAKFGGMHDPYTNGVREVAEDIRNIIQTSIEKGPQE